MNKLYRSLILMLLCLSVSLPLLAAGFDQADEARIFNTPLGADTLGMGNAGTATWTGFSTDNPAALGAWQEKKRSVNFTGSSVNFSGAPSVKTGEIGVTIPISEQSILDISLGNTQSNRGTTLGGDNFEITKDPYLVIQVGSEVKKNLFTEGDALSLGVMLAPRVGRTIYRFYDAGAEVLRTDSKIYGFGAGALYKLSEDLGFGVSYNEWRISTVALNLASDTEESIRSSLKSFKLGVGKKITDKLFLTVEAQRFSGTAKTWQLAGGAEYCSSEQLCWYGGWNGAGPTVGVGIYGDVGTINVGYTSRMARYTKEQFGESPTFSVTFTKNF
ncbi:MAG: hypothetical protein Q8P23_02965 [bacterium]|nr:hypothetical protein [bacterium]